MNDLMITYPAQMIFMIEPTGDPDNPISYGEIVIYPTGWLEIIDNGVLISAQRYDTCEAV